MKLGEARELGFRISGLIEPCADIGDKVINHDRYKSISGYANQALNAYPNMPSHRYVRRMEKTADEKRDMLRRHIAEQGHKIARWAKASGVDKNSIYNFLNGHSQSLDMLTYAKLARTSKVPVWKLTGEAPEPPSPTSIWVVGKVQAGLFVDAVEWDQSDWFAIDVPVPPKFRTKAKALQVAGSSMDLEYREGSVVIWVDMLDYKPAEHGDHVIVYSYCRDDQIEATVKELRIDDAGQKWLWPRSSKPEFQAPLSLKNLPPEIVNVEIKGIVIGDYRPRVF